MMMTARSTQRSTRSGTLADERADATVVYVYAVIPADVDLDPEATGIGEPPQPLTLIAHDGVAALAGEIPARRLGTPEDLFAHARIVDAAAAEVPTLPLRFGAVMADRESVVAELLAPNAERFAASLAALDGRVQFVVKGRYARDAVLREVLDEQPQARRLRERVVRNPGVASRDDSVALGEVIAKSVHAKRLADTGQFIDRVEGLGVRCVVREPTHEFDAVHVACLLARSDERRLRRVADRFARDQEGRIEMRLLGPMAAYDFVSAGLTGG